MFRHTELQKRVDALPHFERVINTPDGRSSALVSLTVNTSADGIICCGVSLDYVTSDKRTIASYPLSIYGFHQQQHALDDARALADRYGIDLRLATERVGWTIDSPVVKPTIATPTIPDFTV